MKEFFKRLNGWDWLFLVLIASNVTLYAIKGEWLVAVMWALIALFAVLNMVNRQFIDDLMETNKDLLELNKSLLKLNEDILGAHGIKVEE